MSHLPLKLCHSALVGSCHAREVTKVAITQNKSLISSSAAQRPLEYKTLANIAQIPAFSPLPCIILPT